MDADADHRLHISWAVAAENEVDDADGVGKFGYFYFVFSCSVHIIYYLLLIIIFCSLNIFFHGCSFSSRFRFSLDRKMLFHFVKTAK